MSRASERRAQGEALAAWSLMTIQEAAKHMKVSVVRRGTAKIRNILIPGCGIYEDSRNISSQNGLRGSFGARLALPVAAVPIRPDEDSAAHLERLRAELRSIYAADYRAFLGNAVVGGGR